MRGTRAGENGRASSSAAAYSCSAAVIARLLGCCRGRRLFTGAFPRATVQPMKTYLLPGIAAGLLACCTPALASMPVTLLVNPMIGTSTTPDGSDVIDDFPGADVPWGMVQWSPDTPSQNAGGGYDFNDTAITGFSLTHLSGPGCNVFGDFSILPFSGNIPTDPNAARQPFSHATEESAPA